MLYNLIKRWRGKEAVVMTDQLPKVNDYKKKISSSQRKGVKGQRVEYFIVPAEEGDNEKYKMPSHNIDLSGRSGPLVIKK